MAKLSTVSMTMLMCVALQSACIRQTCYNTANVERQTGSSQPHQHWRVRKPVSHKDHNQAIQGRKPSLIIEDEASFGFSDSNGSLGDDDTSVIQIAEQRMVQPPMQLTMPTPGSFGDGSLHSDNEIDDGIKEANQNKVIFHPCADQGEECKCLGKMCFGVGEVLQEYETHICAQEYRKTGTTCTKKECSEYAEWLNIEPNMPTCWCDRRELMPLINGLPGDQSEFTYRPASEGIIAIGSYGVVVKAHAERKKKAHVTSDGGSFHGAPSKRHGKNEYTVPALTKANVSNGLSSSLEPGFVAVKFIATKYLNSEEKNQLDQEVALQRRAAKTNQWVPKVYDAIPGNDALFFIQEFAEGEELFDFWRAAFSNTKRKEKTHGINALTLHKIFSQVVQAVQLLHKGNIAHRDIKMENIRRDTVSGRLKLVDFGFAAEIKPNAKKPKDLRYDPRGTIDYAAPEILPGLILQVKSHEVGHNQKVDIWAMGVLLYVLVFGFFPFMSGFEGTGMTEQYVMNNFAMKGKPIYGYREEELPKIFGPDRGVTTLLKGMFQPDVEIRFGIPEILDSDWMKTMSGLDL